MNKPPTDPERQQAILKFIRDYKRFFSEVERATLFPSGESLARRGDAFRDEGKRFEKLLLTIRAQ